MIDVGSASEERIGQIVLRRCRISAASLDRDVHLRLRLSQSCGGLCNEWSVANLAAILPNGANGLRVVNVLRWVLFQNDEIRLFPGGKRSVVVFNAEQPGCVYVATVIA
jgi:hypothetical protein